MKIQADHLHHLKSAIEPLITPQVIEAYETGNFARAEKTKDLQKRFCFDLLHAARLTPFVCDTLYKYLNDDHLYTALKSIAPKLSRKF